MKEGICSKCNKIIYKIPCPYCGSVESHLEAYASDRIEVGDHVGAVIVSGSSEVTIEKDNQVVTKRFDPGVSSGSIVNDTFSNFGLQFAPQYLRDQIKDNIEKIEQYDNEHQGEKITDEYSFGVNLGIFRFSYKRLIENKKK